MPIQVKKGGYKRHFKSKEDQRKLKKARIDAASFTSPEFKVLISNSASTFLAFERFNDYIKEYSGKTVKEQRTSYDLVSEYLLSAPGCKEIFDVIANKDVYSKSEVVDVLVTLGHILSALGKEEYKEKFPTSAENICKSLVEGHFQKIYNLVISGKGKVNKAALGLLTVVSTHGSLATRLLYTSISFVKEDIHALYTEKVVAKLRQPFITFLLTMVQNAPLPVLKAIIEEKGLLNGMFSDLHTDSYELIEKVLTTLDKYVLSNPAISKTQRVKLFNITTVPQILECYKWKKPVKREKDMEAQKGVPVEETKVRKLVCKFIKGLLSEPKKCITFSDPEFGQGDRNMNHVVTHILSKSVLRDSYKDSELEEVVISCLSSRPDQLHRYLAVLEESALLVKNTDTWLTVANHVIKLMHTLPSFDHYVKSVKNFSDETLCNIALALTSPTLSTTKIFKHVLSMPELSWQYSSLALVLVVMSRARETTAAVSKLLTVKRFETWQSLFVDKFMQLMPHVDVLLNCWTSIKKTLKAPELNTVRPNFAGRVLDILTLYVELSPVSIYQSTMPINVSAILQDIDNMAAVVEDSDEDNSAVFGGLTVKALQLLSDLGDEAGLAAMKMKKEKRSTLLMILKLIYGRSDSDTELSSQARQLLSKQLRQSGWFEKLDDELNAWLDNGEKLQSVEFLEKIFITLFSNPYPYLDMVCEAVTAVSDHKKQGRVVENKPLPFSPLVTIALKHFEEFGQSVEIHGYMQVCLSHILIRQDNPLPLAYLLSQKKKLGLSQVAKVLLEPRKIVSKVCCLTPYNCLWDIFFRLDCKSEESVSLRSSLKAEDMSTADRETTYYYCHLALWHCLGANDENVVTSQVCDVMKSLLKSHSKYSNTLIHHLLQSGVMNKWYMCDKYDCGTGYHITSVCNDVLGAIPLALQDNHIEMYKSRILSSIKSLDQRTDVKVVTLILQSVDTFVYHFSSQELLSLIRKLTDTKYDHLEGYWSCLVSCIQKLYLKSPNCYSEVNQKHQLPLVLSTLTDAQKFKLMLRALPDTDGVELQYFYSPKYKTPSLSTAEVIQFLCTDRQLNADFLLKILSPLDATGLLKNRMLFDELAKCIAPDDHRVKELMRIWRPYYEEVKGHISSGKILSWDSRILAHVVQYAKETDVRELASLLIDSEVLFDANANVVGLTLSILKLYPNLYPKLLAVVVNKTSWLLEEDKRTADRRRPIVDDIEQIGSALTSVSLNSEVKIQIKEVVSNKWKDFVRQVLRKNYKHKYWLRLISSMARNVYSSDDDHISVDLSSSDLFDLLVNHSQFLPFVLNGDESSKGELLSLLILLVEASPSICSTDHLPLWLSSYHATLSSNDRKLLHLMFLCETSGISTIKYRPYLWGEAGTTHYGLMKNVVHSLSSQPSVDAVIECLDADKLVQSAYNLPLHRVLSSTDGLSSSDSMEQWGEVETLYDPAFLLPLFAYIMRPDNTLNTRQLIDTGVITYVLCCLTSHVEDVRAAARFILHEFRQHLESSVYSESIQGLFVLDLLKESIPSENARIPPIIAIFISKSLQLPPEDHMYRVCHNYLLIKPKMELELVPEFFRLFYSSSQGFTVERSWILQLLLDGLREDSDFKIYEKLNVFKSLMAYGQCKLCSHQDRVTILEVMSQACKLSISYQTVIKYNILGWLSCILYSFPDVVSNVLKCFKLIAKKKLADKSWFEMFCTQMVTTLISIMKRVSFTEKEGQMFVDIVYDSVITRKDVRHKTESDTLAISLCEAQAIVKYLPRVNSNRQDELLRLTYVKPTSM